MRIIVFFDLPTQTKEHRQGYQKFHKFLVDSGYIMMQESVYCKLSLNGTSVKIEKERIIRNKPKEGIIQILVITEKQFSNMEYIIGEKQSKILDTDKRIVYL